MRVRYTVGKVLEGVRGKYVPKHICFPISWGSQGPKHPSKWGLNGLGLGFLAHASAESMRMIARSFMSGIAKDSKECL
jgi:hypothetical protein